MLDLTDISEKGIKKSHRYEFCLLRKTNIEVLNRKIRIIVIVPYIGLKY